MVPTDALAEIKNSEAAEDGEGDDFLDDFEFDGGEVGVAPAVGRDHEQVLEEGDAPACEDHEPEWRGLELEVSVPGERHEDVRRAEEEDREPLRVEHRFYLMWWDDRRSWREWK